MRREAFTNRLRPDRRKLRSSGRSAESREPPRIKSGAETERSLQPIRRASAHARRCGVAQILCARVPRRRAKNASAKRPDVTSDGRSVGNVSDTAERAAEPPRRERSGKACADHDDARNACKIDGRWHAQSVGPTLFSANVPRSPRSRSQDSSRNPFRRRLRPELARRPRRREMRAPQSRLVRAHRRQMQRWARLAEPAIDTDGRASLPRIKV